MFLLGACCRMPGHDWRTPSPPDQKSPDCLADSGLFVFGSMIHTRDGHYACRPTRRTPAPTAHTAEPALALVISMHCRLAMSHWPKANVGWVTRAVDSYTAPLPPKWSITPAAHPGLASLTQAPGGVCTTRRCPVFSQKRTPSDVARTRKPLCLGTRNQACFSRRCVCQVKLPSSTNSSAPSGQSRLISLSAGQHSRLTRS